MDVGGRATHGAVAERVGESEARGRGSIQQTLLLDSYPLFLAFSATAPCSALPPASMQSSRSTQRTSIKEKESFF
jgi:hypothetical protein